MLLYFYHVLLFWQAFLSRSVSSSPLFLLDISTGQQIGFGDGGAGGAIVGDGKLEEMEVRMASV